MDPALRALCLEVLGGDVDSDTFASLLIETGVNIDSHEWDVASKLLGKGDAMDSLTKVYGKTIH